MLYETVKALCESKSITIAELERKISVGNGSIQKWKKSFPSADRLKKVADYFGVSTDSLLGRKEQLSAESHELAKVVDGLSPAKQELVKQYINMLQAS